IECRVDARHRGLIKQIQKVQIESHREFLILSELVAMGETEISLSINRTTTQITASKKYLWRHGRGAVDSRSLRSTRCDGLERREFGRITSGRTLPIQDVGAEHVEDVRSVCLQPAVVGYALGSKPDEGQVKCTAHTRRKSTVNQVWFIGAGQSGVVTVQAAKGVVGIEVVILR